MILYLSMSSDNGTNYIYNNHDISQLNVLISHEYKKALYDKKPKQFKNFMADSGAFTAMNAGKKIDEQYINTYCDWIIENDIDNYIEMDLDEIVGYEKVLEIRKFIEKRTGKPCIPVWHLSRGAEGWKRMVQEYDYCALSLSGFTDSSKWLRKHKYEPLKFFLNEANKNNCKVHALGCNQIELMKRFHFYSCDSSCHTLGYRYGKIYDFRNGQLKTVDKRTGFKKDAEKLTGHNADVMIEVMKYAEFNM